MSQPNTPENLAAASAGRGAGSDLSRMMHEGRSFSSHERNCCFLNTGAAPSGGGRFANISALSGLDFPDDGRALALVDWDHDGDLDMWISNRNAPRLRLMRNEQPRGNHSLALRLVGNGENTNRDAIGARVEVVLGGPGEQRPLIKTLRAGEGFLAQSSKWVHFGLGKVDTIDRVTVRWPGGELEQFSGMEADHRYRLVQGSGMVQDIGQPARETVLASAPQDIKPPSQTARVPLVELLPMPRSLYTGFDGREQQLSLGGGRLLLVNLWASWCAPCQVELEEFSERYEELQASGIDVLALSVEGLGEDPEKGASTARRVSEGKFPFPVGLATASLASDFQSEHNRHLPLHKKLPLPSSFLIDREGRLSVIYKGKVSVDQLLADAAHSEGDRHARMLGSSPLGGQSIRHPRVEGIAVDEAEFLRFYAAAEFQGSGRIGEVVRQYADVVRFKPESYMAQSNLGNALAKLGRDTEAIAHLQKASQIKPDEAVPYFNLANVLQGQGEVSSAIELYQKVLAIDPQFVDARLNLGMMLQRSRDTVGAIDHFQEALLTKPEDAKIHALLGSAFKQQRKLGRAVDSFEMALQFEPEYAEGHSDLANVLLAQGKIAEAIAHYQRAIEINPGFATARFNLASALQRQGDNATAIKHHRQVLLAMPDHPMVHARLGDALRDEGEIPAAITHYTRALNLKSDFPQPMNELAWIRATHPNEGWRDGARAVALAERCCQLTGNRMLPALSTLAAAYAETGRFGEAVRWQAKAIELAPDSGKADLEARLLLYREGKPFRDVPRK